MSPTLRRSRRRGRAGYTIVELMMSLALLTVGVLGTVSMEKAAIVSNAHAKNLATAQRIGQSWAGQLQMDSNAWRQTFNAGGLLQLPSNAWIRPAFVAGRLGGAFDALGNPLGDTPAELLRARYCVHTRTAWLYNAANVAGNGVMRAEIRVFWQRDGQSVLVPNDGLCALAQNASDIGLASSSYHFVYQTVAVRQRPQF